MPKRSLKLKFGVRQLLMATAALFAGLVVWSARATDDSLAPSTGAVKAPDLTVHYSAGLYEILKMADAKVDPEVIKAYIKNSPIAYDPSAAEIIALKEHGLPADVLTGLLQRGGELRAQATQAGRTAPPQAYSAPAAPYSAAPAYAYDYGTAYPDYGYGYPDYSYVYPGYSYGYNYPGYSYGYNYPGYSYGYNYGYPWPFFYSSFYFDNFGHRHFFHHHFGDHHFPGHRGGDFHPHSFAGRGGFATGSHAGGFHSFGSSSAGFQARGGGFRSMGNSMPVRTGFGGAGHFATMPSRGGGSHFAGGGSHFTGGGGRSFGRSR